MLFTKLIVILPKEDAYTNRSDDYKTSFRSIIKSRCDKYKNYNIEMCHIAEDELAYELLAAYKPTIYTCLSAMDQVMLRKYSSIYKDYSRLTFKSVDRDIIKASVSSCKVKLLKDETKDSTLKKTISIISERRRYVVSKLLTSQNYVILYFDKNNQYCNLQAPKLGDCRMVHYVNMNTLIEEFSFSGQTLNESTYFNILKGGTE